MIKTNNLDSWRAFLRHVKTHKFVFSPLEPRSNLLFSKITWLFHFIMKTLYTLTKFGNDWLIFVDTRVLKRKLWMDRRRTEGQTLDGRTDGHQRTVSDHKSSLSTPC